MQPFIFKLFNILELGHQYFFSIAVFLQIYYSYMLRYEGARPCSIKSIASFATWHASIYNEVTVVVCRKGTSISDKDHHFAQPCTDLRQGPYTLVTCLGLDIGLYSVLLLKDVFQHLRMLLFTAHRRPSNRVRFNQIID